MHWCAMLHLSKATLPVGRGLRNVRRSSCQWKAQHGLCVAVVALLPAVSLGDVPQDTWPPAMQAPGKAMPQVDSTWPRIAHVQTLDRVGWFYDPKSHNSFVLKSQKQTWLARLRENADLWRGWKTFVAVEQSRTNERKMLLQQQIDSLIARERSADPDYLFRLSKAYLNAAAYHTLNIADRSLPNEHSSLPRGTNGRLPSIPSHSPQLSRALKLDYLKHAQDFSDATLAVGYSLAAVKVAERAVVATTVLDKKSYHDRLNRLVSQKKNLEEELAFTEAFYAFDFLSKEVDRRAAESLFEIFGDLVSVPAISMTQALTPSPLPDFKTLDSYFEVGAPEVPAQQTIW